MALTSEHITAIFKLLGKYIYLSDRVVAFSDTCSEGLTALVQQGLNDYDDEAKAALFSDIIVILNNNIKALTTITNKTPAALVTNMTRYLRKVVAPLAGLLPTVSVTVVLEAINETMLATGQYLAPDGDFFNFIDTNLEYPLPQTGTELIPESYISESPFL